MISCYFCYHFNPYFLPKSPSLGTSQNSYNKQILNNNKTIFQKKKTTTKEYASYVITNLQDYFASHITIVESKGICELCDHPLSIDDQVDLIRF